MGGLNITGITSLSLSLCAQIYTTSTHHELRHKVIWETSSPNLAYSICQILKYRPSFFCNKTNKKNLKTEHILWYKHTHTHTHTDTHARGRTHTHTCKHISSRIKVIYIYIYIYLMYYYLPAWFLVYNGSSIYHQRAISLWCWAGLLCDTAETRGEFIVLYPR